MKQKSNIKKGTVQETLLLPLWGRAIEAQKEKPLLNDRMAAEIIDKIDYDFSVINKNIGSLSQHGWVARSLHTDRIVLNFIKQHPEATIVNIGCGMDTTFSRIDNGKIKYYELDLPEVIELRKAFFKETERYKSISSSFLDTQWFEKITVNDGLLLTAGGVLYYTEEEKIKKFFIALADHFGRCELFFDSLSPFGIKVGNKQVLKAGGINITLAAWGLKSAKSIEKWDDRIAVVESIPMYKGMKQGLPLSQKIALIVPDTLGVCHMVHLRIG
jgi:O-methyltransferase involved in polyketide biosynthesis